MTGHRPPLCRRPLALPLLLAVLLLGSPVVTVPLLAQETPSTDDVQNTPVRDDPTTVTQTTPPAVDPPASDPPASNTTTPPPVNPDRGGSTADPTTPTTPNPGDFAEDLVRAEAERTLPPPLPVVRLDDPGFVFSSADPEVAAGVQAWIQTLEGPVDQFGNFKGPGYRGSFRPSSVNTKLLQFLAEYLKEKRLVAITDGQAQQLAGLQDQTRRDTVESIVTQRRTEFEQSQAATPTTSGNSGSSEDVPNIADGSDGNAGDGSSSGNSGTTTQTSDPGSGTTTSSSGTGGTTTGPSASGPLTAQKLEAEFPGIRVLDEPSVFSTEELGMLRDTLSRLPSTFYKDTILQRTQVISIDGAPNPDVYGVARTSSGSKDAILELSSKSFSDNPADRVDFPTPPYPDDVSKSLQFRGTIAHELTHRFMRVQPGDKFHEDINDHPFISGEDGWASKFGWQFDPSKQKWTLDKGRTREVATAYAAAESPNEDIAESVMLFIYDPQRLKAASQARYDFIKSKFGISEQPNADITYPPPKDDPRFQPQQTAQN